MTEPRREVLVLLDPAEADFALLEIDSIAQARVAQRIGGQLALVALGDDGAAELLRAVSGVQEVWSASVPGEVKDGLDATERLFVDAWEARARPKDRPGEGLSWDAPGHEAPDYPSDGSR